jgi:hypothetical protein
VNVDKFLNGYSQLVSHGTPSPKDVSNVRRWLAVIRPSAIDERESEYINHDNDLVSVQPSYRSLGSTLLEKISFGGPWNPRGIPWLRDRFSKEAPRDIVSLQNEETLYSNYRKMEKVSTVVISVAALAMLIGPIWILAFLKPMTHRLAVISSFIVVFFVVLAITMSRLYESLAATAAYSAVLVVFLQSGVGLST